MSKRMQKDAGEERVTAKSKPMMNLVSRYRVRDPNVLASTASQSLGKIIYESQLPPSSRNEQNQRTGIPVLDASSSNYSEWNADKNWSSQEWKSDDVMEDRTGRPVNEQPPGLFAEHTDRFIVDDDDMDSNTVAESDLSLISRSFLHRVIQDQSSNMQRKTATNILFLVNVCVFDIASICIHGKGILRKFTLHQKYSEQSHNETDVRNI